MAIAEAPAVTENGLTPAEKRHLGSLEKRIEQGLQTFKEVGVALLEIRDSRLYRDAHGTFEDYCRARWQLDKNRAYQFIGAAEVVKALGNPKALTNEAQARELVPLFHEDPKAVQEVWTSVEEIVRQRGTPVTAAIIREAREQVVNPTGPVPPTMVERLLAEFGRCTDMVSKWKETHPRKRDMSSIKAAYEHLGEVLVAR